MEVKEGEEINCLLIKMEVELVHPDESVETLIYTWETVDALFLKALMSFLIRKFK